MRNNRRNPWVLLLLIFIGALIGGVGGEALSQIPYMDWISFGGLNGYQELFAVSFHPLIDFRILRFGFDFALNINAGSIVGMLLSILLYVRI